VNQTPPQEKRTPNPSAIEEADPLENPAKPSDPSPATLPEIPKVGTEDAPGG
jgi:hypothetical protein